MLAPSIASWRPRLARRSNPHTSRTVRMPRPARRSAIASMISASGRRAVISPSRSSRPARHSATRRGISRSEFDEPRMQPSSFFSADGEERRGRDLDLLGRSAARRRTRRCRRCASPRVRPTRGSRDPPSRTRSRRRPAGRLAHALAPRHRRSGRAGRSRRTTRPPCGALGQRIATRRCAPRPRGARPAPSRDRCRRVPSPAPSRLRRRAPC